MALSMPDCGALLTALLSEVKTLSEVVRIQGCKTDAILAKLSIRPTDCACEDQMLKYVQRSQH